MTHDPNLIIVVDRIRWEVGVKFLIGTSHLEHDVAAYCSGTDRLCHTWCTFPPMLAFLRCSTIAKFYILVIFDTVRLGGKMQFTGREFSLKTKTKKTTTFSMQSIHPSKSNSSDSVVSLHALE